MSKRVRIIADTGSDLPQSLCKQRGIELVGMGVEIDGVARNGLEVSAAEVYQKMREGSVPHTSQVPYTDLEAIVKKTIERGEIAYYVCFSSRLSGSYQTGHMLKQELNHPDFILFDTKAASIGLGMMVLEAAEMAENGESAEKITERLEYLSGRMEHIFAVDDLVYLKRGGRISSMKAIIGGMLKIKPILHFIDGAIHQFDKARSTKQVIGRMVDIMAERADDIDSQKVIGISHADCPDVAEELKKAIVDRFGQKEFIVHEIGPVIGAHAGPGTIALFFFSKKQGGGLEA